MVSLLIKTAVEIGVCKTLIFNNEKMLEEEELEIVVDVLFVVKENVDTGTPVDVEVTAERRPVGVVYIC